MNIENGARNKLWFFKNSHMLGEAIYLIIGVEITFCLETLERKSHQLERRCKYCDFYFNSAILKSGKVKIDMILAKNQIQRAEKFEKVLATHIDLEFIVNENEME